MATCTGSFGDRETAADLTQETFLRAYRSLATVRAAAAFRPWFFRIATNLARDHLRRQRRIRWIPLETNRTESAAPPFSSLEEADVVRGAVLLLCAAESLS